MTVELILDKIKKTSNNKRKFYLDRYVFDLNNKKNGKNFHESNNLSFKQRLQSHYICKKLYDKILPLLANRLNLIHSCKFEKEFWEIVVGPWLSNFISISYYRYNKIKHIFKKNNISSTFLMENSNQFIPTDNLELNKLSNNLNWNGVFFSNLIKYLKPKIKSKIKKVNIMKKFQKENFNFVKKIISYLLSLFYKKNDPVIVSTYLPFFENLKLFLYLKQIPKIWMSPKLNRTKINFLKREKLVFKNLKKKNFENFVKEQIYKTIPLCHIELFGKIKKDLEEKKLPKTPKFIYTSNSYEYDEYFKLYVALKKGKTKYIIGQHGNVSWLENMYFENQHKADHYLYWGKNGFGKKENGFNFKIRRKKINYNSSGYLLIFDSPFGTNNKIFNRINENYEKEKVLKHFLSKLDKEIKNNIIFKLHSSYKKRKSNYIQNIKKICPQIKIEIDDNKSYELVKNSRCVVHMYDSTGILETMTYNIPTVCIWQNKFNHIIQKYHKLYFKLQKCNIFFNNPNDLSKHINKNWKNFNNWWSRKELQNYRMNILNELSNIPKNDSVYKLSQKLIRLTSH